jgi:hypothetical protein
MQLETALPQTPVRARLKAATCMLLASVAPLAHGADQPASASSQIEISGLLYNERITVFEPTVRFTRLSPSGRSFFGLFTLDTITGASPNGTLPTGTTQTFTSASGRRSTRTAVDLPTTEFSDHRFALEGGLQQPLKFLNFSLGGHASHEKDYESLGVNGSLSVDFNHKLSSLTFGAGYNSDTVSPVGGTSVGLSPSGTLTGVSDNAKHVTTWAFGGSQVMSKRWLVGLTGSLATENGYLTDPYKGLSIIDRVTGVPVSELTEKRPDTRKRKSVQADSVYHFTSNILYLSYRHYWDDWGIRSETIDGRYRIPVGDANYLEPHLRLYNQTAADFYTWGLIRGQPIPSYASTDYRLGALTTFTLGATYGFRPGGRSSESEWTVRAEYIGQFGNSYPAGTVGVQQRVDLFPTINVFSLVLSYKFNR